MSSHEVASASSSAEMVQSTMQAFRCPWCRMSFDSAILLNAHMETKHKKNRDFSKPFMCKACGKQFCLKDNLVNHLKQKPTCLRIYRKNYSEALEEHQEPVPVETLPVVKEIIQNQEEAIAPIASTFQHSASNDDQQGSVDKFGSPISNEVSDRNMDSSTSVDCVIANTQSLDRPLSEESVTMEQTSKDDVKPKKYSCADCDKVFNNRFTLWRHKKLRRDCEKSSLPIFDPNEHMVTSTTSDGNIVKFYKCPECSKIFAKSHYLKLHMTAHSSLKVSCSICNKKYSNTKFLKAHMQQMHGKFVPQEQSDGASPLNTSTENQEASDDDTDVSDSDASYSEDPLIMTYECSQCPSEFLSTDLLDLHESTHLSEQLFMCKGCGKKYFLEKNLKSHLLLNPQCKKNVQTSFASTLQQTKVTTLIVEPKDIGSGQTYKCPYCERCFPTITYLKQHIPVHSSAKAFACKPGVNEHASKGSLIRHMIPQCQQNSKSSSHESTLTSIVRIARNQKFPTIIPAETVSTLTISEGNNKSGCSSSSTTSDIGNLTKAETVELSRSNDVIRSASPQNISTLISKEANINNPQISNSSDCLRDKMSVEQSVQGNQNISINDLQNNAFLPPFVTTPQPPVPNNLNLSLPGFCYPFNFASFTQNTGCNLTNIDGHYQTSNSSESLKDKISVEQNNASLSSLVTTTQPSVSHNQPLPLPGFCYPLNFASFTQNTGSNLTNFDGQGIGNNQVNQSTVPTMAAPFYFMPYCFPFNQMQQMPAPCNLGSLGQTPVDTFSHCANQSQGLSNNHFAHNPVLPQNWGFHQNPGLIFPNLPNIQQSFRESDVQPKSVGTFSIENILK